jgi:hypothetical protein
MGRLNVEFHLRQKAEEKWVEEILGEINLGSWKLFSREARLLPFANQSVHQRLKVENRAGRHTHTHAMLVMWVKR